MAKRPDGRAADELRPVKLEPGYLDHVPGSVLASVGRTRILCTAMLEERVPPFLALAGTGWLTAEYAMLPGSTPARKARGTGGRETEIQRLIGRSLRAALDLEALGPRTFYVDCDVLAADGGTRTAAITAGWVALALAVRRLAARGEVPPPERLLRAGVAAVSVGLLAGEALLDLAYVEDSRAEVDLNVVLNAEGRFVEIQGTAESRPFTGDELSSMLALARRGTERLAVLQREALGL